MAWLVLILSAVLEAVWATALSQSNGLTEPVPSVVFLVATVASVVGLGWAMRTIPTGTAYAVWTGIGAVGAFIVGVTVLGEALTPMRIAAAVLIVSGLVMMKLSAN